MCICVVFPNYGQTDNGNNMYADGNIERRGKKNNQKKNQTVFILQSDIVCFQNGGLFCIFLLFFARFNHISGTLHTFIIASHFQ